MAGYFDAKEAVAFAETLADDFHQLFAKEEPTGKRHKEQKRLQRLSTLIEKAFAFSHGQRLNFYKKSKFLAALKFRLKELGHSEEEVRNLLSALLPRI